MEKVVKKVTTVTLREMLMSKGFTYRQSRKIITSIIDEMIQAAQRGEEIDLPFGLIRPIKNKNRGQRLWKLNRIVRPFKWKYRFYFRPKNPNLPWT